MTLRFKFVLVLLGLLAVTAFGLDSGRLLATGEETAAVASGTGTYAQLPEIGWP